MTKTEEYKFSKVVALLGKQKINK